MTEVPALTVDPSNAEQVRAWDGDEGAYWADNADHFDRAVAAYHDSFLAAAGIRTTEHVLDIGCGTGQTTRDAARAAISGSAFGGSLVADDRARSSAFRAGGRRERPLRTSRCADPPLRPRGVRRRRQPHRCDVLRRPGRRVHQHRPGVAPRRTTHAAHLATPSHNEWIRAFSSAFAAGRDLPTPPPEAPGPFSLADPDRIRSVIGAAGFADVQIDGASAGMWFGHDAEDAYRFMLGLLGWMLEGLDDDGRGRALDALRATIVAHDTDECVVYPSATWIISARRP